MQKYTGKDGNQYFKPAWSALESAIEDGTTGFCLSCGTECDGVEPDARKYDCESCGAKGHVYGAEELLLRRLFHADPDDVPDTPSLEDGRDNCNDWGTGEGRYHGRI